MVIVTRKQKEQQEKIENELLILRQKNEELHKKLDQIIASMEYNSKDLAELKEKQSKLLTTS